MVFLQRINDKKKVLCEITELCEKIEFYIYCVIIVVNLNSVRLENNGAWQSGILDLLIFTFYILYVKFHVQ